MQEDRASFARFFEELTGNAPHRFQLEVAKSLFAGKNVLVRAPTGAGKTMAVVAPFFYPGWRKRRPARLIYALPLRTLAQGIYETVKGTAARQGKPIESERDATGRETVSPFVTLQTGEQPDDPFFDRGRVIVTTYDQVLSGLLAGPYGLSGRLHNINAAAVAGALVVFDEFHLMESSRAFLTAVAELRLFGPLSQSVWMTATATSPLTDLLRESLDVVSIPENDDERRRMWYSLPSVQTVKRTLHVESRPLSAEAVIRQHERRSIVLVNTVARAQAIYQQLREALSERRFEHVPLILLHSRFFKSHRSDKERKLRVLFGKGGEGGILVATQVIEAGIDISCENLHTEICPMNALVQRAGRCARFPGETGTVHVYPLPPEERSWLPYGDLQGEAHSLLETKRVLDGVSGVEMDPVRAAEWVEEVHREEDELGLRVGWYSRLKECQRRIQQTAILREAVRIADLIRGEETERIRVIVARPDDLPRTPGEREGLNLSRRALARLLRTGISLGFSWAGEEGWMPLCDEEVLKRSYVLCLRPEMAAYDENLGLRLGEPGIEVSPPREEPPRPGHRPLQKESWAAHSRQVVFEAERRWREKDGNGEGLLAHGLCEKFQINPEEIRVALRAAAWLHDLGKLQQGWQRWAEATQRLRYKGFRLDEPLAHTDFNRNDAKQEGQERALGIRRPPHAAASAYYGRALLPYLLDGVSGERKAYLASACLAAVVAHHGGWWREEVGLNPPPLWPGWEQVVERALGRAPDKNAMAALATSRTEQLLELTVGSDAFERWWPLVAYLTRSLRLSDQRATEEGGE